MARPSLLPLLGLALALGLTAPVAMAQPLVYQPRNPAFGGNPINYSWMMSSAQAQNDYEEERSSAFNRDPLADFEQNLQRQILNGLARELIGNRFGDLDLTEAGTFAFGDFTVEVIPGLGEVTIRIFNLLTGDESVVTIPSLP